MGYKRAFGSRANATSQLAGMSKLQAELRAGWRSQAPLQPAEARNIRPQDMSGFPQYIGRPVLSKTFAYVLQQWEKIAGEHDVDFSAVKPPIGVRYLGFTTLRSIKYCSKYGHTEEDGVIPNVLFEPVHAVGQIVDNAFADPENFNVEVGGDKATKYGTRLVVRQYAVDQALRIILGVELSETRDVAWNPATSLVQERRYFVTHYDPYHDSEDSGADQMLRQGSIYVPLGMVNGLADLSDERFQAMAAVCQDILPIKTTLGPVQLVEEQT